MNNEIVESFASLFAGRRDAYGADHGQAVYGPPPYDRHLSGEEPIGIYPLVAAEYDPRTFVVKWGCVDFDEGYEESWPDAVNVHNALRAFDITAWIERSRSKGWHVWVFAVDWTKATLMRNALMAACQLVDAPTREVNPKQTELNDGGLGNYVRLPYPGGGGTTQIVVHPDAPENCYPLDDFTRRALAARCTADDLKPLADKATIPKQKQIAADMPDDGQMTLEIYEKLSPLARHILMEGPGDLPNARSDTLWKLARMLWEDRTTTLEESWQALQAADERWGKFIARGDTDDLWALLVKAWAQEEPF